ncbi:EamA family transporter [Allohahella marinimesophila]|uniref:EamA family transporter n=1 Tax=Allohahella marinimesophila TaxID=1054972 RepID=A0ABP7PLV7_9GAMM
MEDWILFTLMAAFAQNIRSTVQKALSGGMGVWGVTFTRFVYALPFAWLYWFSLDSQASVVWSTMPALFWLTIATAGCAQILATKLLVQVFSLGQFAVGTAYSKTEPILAAVVGFLLLGDTMNLLGLVLIMVTVAGVMMLATARSSLSLETIVAALSHRPAMIGLASGLAFAICTVLYRAASQQLTSLQPEGVTIAPIVAAGTVLVSVLSFQTLLMGTWLFVMNRRDLLEAFRRWRVAIWSGIAGCIASIGWITAVTFENAGYVKALGQVELIFSVATGYFLFRETPSSRELLGIVVIASGIVLLVLGT